MRKVHRKARTSKLSKGEALKLELDIVVVSIYTVDRMVSARFHFTRVCASMSHCTHHERSS